MHFLNLEHARETVGRLIRALTGDYCNSDQLDAAYRTGISKIRPIAPPEAGISVSFEDGDWGRYLVAKNLFQDIFVGIEASSEVQRLEWENQVAAAIQHVRKVNSGLGGIIDLLVTDIVVLQSERTGGGSASHIPGLVCMSPGDDWTVFDFAESLMHEATHLNLFVADMVYGMYILPTNTLADAQYRVLSAVKVGELRPLDKAFHSAVVAVPLMYMQHERGESTLVDLFRKSLLECTDGLLEKREYFTEYGQMLVDELRRFALTVDFDYVEHSISDDVYSFYKPVAA